MKAHSPAKVNLFLHIVGKRANGYHNLESFFVPLENLYDVVELYPHEKVICECNPIIEDNIVLKIINDLRQKFNINNGAYFKIAKNIPLASGLGGSSTNAATAIMMLNEFWKLNMDTYEMREFGCKFGADIPFFIRPSPAFVEGIGEIITPSKLNRQFHILLVKPEAEVLSSATYKMGFKKFTQKLNLISSDNLIKQILQGHNDLENNAIRITPVISEVLSHIKYQPGCMVTRMSGSGSTCFGLFESSVTALKAQETLSKSFWTHYETINL